MIARATDRHDAEHAAANGLDANGAVPPAGHQTAASPVNGRAVPSDSVYDTQLGRVIRAVALLQTNTFWLGIALGGASSDDPPEQLREDVDQIVVAADALRELINELVDERNQPDHQLGWIPRVSQRLLARVDGLRAGIS